MKRFIAVGLTALMCLQLSATLAACGPSAPKEEEKPDRVYADVSGALSDKVIASGNDYIMKAPGFHLIFRGGSGGYSLEVAKQTGEVLARSEEPVFLTVANEVTNISVDETEYTSTYDGMYSDENGALLAAATIRSDEGSIFELTDVFTFKGNSIDVTRKVSVLKEEKGNEGFSTRIAFRSNIDTDRGDYEDCEYFIPSILYKDEKYNASGSIGSSLRVKQILVKETRTGLPMVMLRNVSDGASISLVRRDPVISSPDERAFSFYTVDNSFKHGSVGIIRDPSPQVCYTYPNFETQGYFVNSGATKRFAEVQEDNSVEFTVGVFGEVYENYTDAMVGTYKEHYQNQTKTIKEVDLERIYETSIRDLGELYCYDLVSGAGGFPFATYVESGENLWVSYQIGFIGMNAALGTQMMRYGIMNNDMDTYEKGFNIIDFWASNAVSDEGVIKIWAYENGSFNRYPSYLRTMADGAEGILAAYELVKDTESVEYWLTAVRNFADFLVSHQMEDGSWYRAYDWHGNMYKDDNPDSLVGDKNTVADSKLNTPVAIRFLLQVYDVTGDERYYAAAVKAGEYTLANLSNAGKYVGGTPDNPNCIDREAGIYALYAFNALYNATGEDKWLYYAEQAAVFTVSWMYTYSFVINEEEGLEPAKPLVNGNNEGLSIIATGHSSVDTFMAYTYYELFKLYVWTADEFWYDLSLYVQNNTKQTIACEAGLDYAYKSFAIEATSIADFYFVSAEGGCWLPWITNANIEPYTNMIDVFGVGDVRDLSKENLQTLRDKLSENYR